VGRYLDADGYNAEQELNRPLPREIGPHARCVLLRHPGGCATLLFTFLHALGDGHSGFFLVRDLFRFLTGTGGPSTGQGTADLPASLQAYLPPETRGVQGSARLLRMMAREAGGYLRAGGPPRRLQLACRPPYFLRLTLLLPVRFDAEFTDRLVRAARRERTSVHGALCAAGLLAVSRVMTDGTPRVLACTSAVDMRSRTRPPIGDEMGLFVSVLWTVQRVGRDRPFWDLAREVRERFAAKIEAGDPALVAGSGGTLLSFLERLPGTNRSERIVRCAERLMFNFKGTGVSNVGQLRMEPAPGGPSLRSVSFAGTLVNLGYFLAVVNTFNGRLTINYLVNDPLVPRARADDLVECAVSVLRRAVP